MEEKKYVITWGNAISIADRRPENYAKDLTLRYPIRPMFDADKLKITLDNFCGTEPVTITKVFVGAVPVTFENGSRSVTIPAGESRVSDETVVDVRRGEDFNISIYLGEFTLMRSAVLITGPLSKGTYTVGDYAESETLPIDLTRKTNWFYFLSDVELYTSNENRAVVCYGDSIDRKSVV